MATDNVFNILYFNSLFKFSSYFVEIFKKLRRINFLVQIKINKKKEK